MDSAVSQHPIRREGGGVYGRSCPSASSLSSILPSLSSPLFSLSDVSTITFLVITIVVKFDNKSENMGSAGDVSLLSLSIF